MGTWKKHYFKDKKTALGFARGAKISSSLSYPYVKKRKNKYMVEVKHYP